MDPSRNKSLKVHKFIKYAFIVHFPRILPYTYTREVVAMEQWILALSPALATGKAVAVIGLIMIGGLFLLRGECRLERLVPEPEAVRAYTDQLVRDYGEAAFRRNGEDSVNARIDGDRELFRFLRAVSEELVRRMLVEQTEARTGAPDTRLPRQFPG